MDALKIEDLKDHLNDERIDGADIEEWMKPGTRVEVRSRFDRTWSRGFEIAEVQPNGYLVRRLSDGAVLPVEFDADDVRRERKQGLWWY